MVRSRKSALITYGHGAMEPRCRGQELGWFRERDIKSNRILQRSSHEEYDFLSLALKGGEERGKAQAKVKTLQTYSVTP